MPDIRTAAEDGDLEKVKEFLQAGDDVNRVDRYGNTPLMLVLSGWGSRVSDGTNSNNDIALVKLLIDHGADVTLANKCVDTPLHLAASTIPLIKSKFPTFMKVEDIKTANFAKDNIPVIHLLLSNGAKVNARNNVGETPLDSALKFNWDNPNKKNALFEIKDVLGPRMLLQDPYTEKPKFLLEALGKEASERWDKQSKQLKYLIEKKSLGTEKQTLKSLNKFYCEKDSLGGQVLNDILKFKLSIEKNDHSQSESLSSTKSVPSLVSR